MDGAGTRIGTQPIRVVVTTDEYEIEGFIHIKPGGYQSRVSDLLNVHDLQYLPVTDATIRTLTQQHKAPRKVDTVILRLADVKMVVPLDEEKAQTAPESGAAPKAENPPGTPPGGYMGGPWGDYGGDLTGKP